MIVNHKKDVDVEIKYFQKTSDLFEPLICQILN